MTAFWDQGYAIVDDVLDQSKLDLVSAAMDISSRNGATLERADGCVTKAEDEYSPVAGEMLLRHCRGAFEAVIGRELVETCAYWRIYHRGAALQRHKDRTACEISVTLPIGMEPEDSMWPIWIKDLHGNPQSIELRPGAGLVYQGHKVEHWREPLTAQSQKQLLFHYILKDGEFTEHALDERKELSFTRRTVTS